MARPRSTTIRRKGCASARSRLFTTWKLTAGTAALSVLADACHVVANIRIRNVATIGGNLAYGDYQSDPPTVLVALDAGLELMRRNAKRRD